MYVRGPQIAAGKKLPHPTNHLDITATIVELALAGEQAPSNLDGLSFASELGPSPSSPSARADAWRQHSFSEFFANLNTWQLVRVVNSTHKFSYMWWCSNDTEVFDMQKDPFQTTNLDGQPGSMAAKMDAGSIVLGLFSVRRSQHA